MARPACAQLALDAALFAPPVRTSRPDLPPAITQREKAFDIEPADNQSGNVDNPCRRNGRKARQERTFMLTRRALATGLALAAPAIIAGRARAAEFNWKFATNQPPPHPSNVQAQAAIDRIRQQSDGRLSITLFPNNQLGGDTDMFSQLRAGAIQLFPAFRVDRADGGARGRRQRRGLRVQELRCRLGRDGRCVRRVSSRQDGERRPACLSQDMG